MDGDNTDNNEHTAVDLSGVAKPFTITIEKRFFFKKADELGNKRAPVELKLPFITVDGLVEALANEKQMNFVVDVVNEQIVDAAKAQVNDDTSPVNEQSQLDLSKLSLAYLASLVKSERDSVKITKEDWQSWAEDYKTVMPTVQKRTEKQVDIAISLFLAKFAPIRGKQDLLGKMKDNLTLYAASTTKLEEFQDIVKYLSDKVTALLSTNIQELYGDV